ncbi:MAG: hypothetical protein JOY80_10250 [Candidatus Dormibacteraeota bacterium]|nr:hypothetical protein [Candidatus Dormibacteraeota bacterium]
MNGIIDLDATVAHAARDFPALGRLCGAYFHQDWHEEYATTAQAVDAFLRDAPPSLRTAVTGDIDRLLQLQLDDDELGRVLRDGLDCNYVPSIDEVTNEQWLTQLRSLLGGSL